MLAATRVPPQKADGTRFPADCGPPGAGVFSLARAASDARLCGHRHVDRRRLRRRGEPPLRSAPRSSCSGSSCGVAGPPGATGRARGGGSARGRRDLSAALEDAREESRRARLLVEITSTADLDDVQGRGRRVRRHPPRSGGARRRAALPPHPVRRRLRIRGACRARPRLGRHRRPQAGGRPDLARPAGRRRASAGEAGRQGPGAGRRRVGLAVSTPSACRGARPPARAAARARARPRGIARSRTAARPRGSAPAERAEPARLPAGARDRRVQPRSSPPACGSCG
jgi:hypothetical protein